MQDGGHLFGHPKFGLATSLPSISTAPHGAKCPPEAPSPSLVASPSRSQHPLCPFKLKTNMKMTPKHSLR